MSVITEGRPLCPRERCALTALGPAARVLENQFQKPPSAIFLVGFWRSALIRSAIRLPACVSTVPGDGGAGRPRHSSSHHAETRPRTESRSAGRQEALRHPSLSVNAWRGLCFRFALFCFWKGLQGKMNHLQIAQTH